MEGQHEHHGNVFYAVGSESVQTCSISLSLAFTFSCLVFRLSHHRWTEVTNLQPELHPERSRMCPDLPDQTRWRQRVYKCSEESRPSATNHSVSTHFTPQTCSVFNGSGDGLSSLVVSFKIRTDAHDSKLIVK